MPVQSLVEGSVVNPDLSITETYDVTYQVPNNGPVFTFSVPKVDDFYPSIEAKVAQLTAEYQQVQGIP